MLKPSVVFKLISQWRQSLEVRGTTKLQIQGLGNMEEETISSEAKKAQKCSLKESVGLDQDLGRLIGTWSTKKRRKLFPTKWKDWTLKPRRCEYVKVSEDFFPRISNSVSRSWNERWVVDNR